jgi:hypothetical protein
VVVSEHMADLEPLLTRCARLQVALGVRHSE